MTNPQTTSYTYDDLRRITLRHGGYSPDSPMSLMEAIGEMKSDVRVSVAPFLMKRFAEHIQELEYAKR